MMRTIVEVSITAIICGEMRQASAEVDVPSGTTWEAVADLASAFGAAYARLWSVPPETVQAVVALVRAERMVERYADVRCGGRVVAGG